MKQFDHAGEATNGPARWLLIQRRIFATTPKGVRLAWLPAVRRVG
jgi:hypothetical protein